jgi:hypothetical protein
MAVTILIDIYLLYIFFTVQQAASRRSQRLWAPGKPGDRSGPHDRIRSDMAEPPREPFGPLGRLLGYVIAILGIAMLVYAIRPPP